MVSVTISVTEDHIARGKRNRVAECPIALAVQEQFPDKDIGVGIAAIRIGLGEDAMYFTLPPAATNFIHNFDFMPSRFVSKPIKFTAYRTLKN